MNYYLPKKESTYVEEHGGRDFLLGLVRAHMAPAPAAAPPATLPLHCPKCGGLLTLGLCPACGRRWR